MTKPKKRNLDLADLRRRIRVDPATGKLYWLRHRRSDYAGREVGTLHHSGYVQVSLDKQLYQAHHLVWALVHGEYPKVRLDHRDGDRSNNHPDNLRAATGSENNQNQPARRGNTSGWLGASRFRDRWQAQIKHRGKITSLGLHNCPTAAHFAYLRAKRTLHKFNPEPRYR